MDRRGGGRVDEDDMEKGWMDGKLERAAAEEVSL